MRKHWNNDRSGTGKLAVRVPDAGGSAAQRAGRMVPLRGPVRPVS